jgi:hypothetical protein
MLLNFKKRTEVEQGFRFTWYRADNITSPLFPRNIRVDIMPAVKAGRRVWRWSIVHENPYPKSIREEGAEVVDSGIESTVAKAARLVNAICNVKLHATQEVK